MVIVSDKRGATDGSAHNMLLQVNSPLPIVLVSRPDGYVFNDALLGIKDYILVDFVEYGWNREFTNTHIWGKNTDLFSDVFQGEEWRKLDNWIANNPPKLTFKRELLSKDVSDTVLPIEYAGMYQIPPVQSKEDFDRRPINVFFSWGYSSEYRRKLHGRIWMKAPKYGYMVCDNLYHLNGFLQHESNPNKWVTMNIPHYNRYPMQDILNVNGMSKVSISMSGAGFKCFRSAESPINSIMAMANNGYAWTFEWKHDNCIKFNVGNEIEDIIAAMNNPELYLLYVNGVATATNYLLPNYILNLEKIINERL